MTHYLVLGAGLQGTAAVHDLICRGNAKALTWVDNDAKRLDTGLTRIRKLCTTELSRPSWEGLHGHVLDASNEAALVPLFKAADVCLNAFPYRFALQMTRLALDGECHYLDLGGNTELVRKQLEMHKAHANASKLCVLPDCGLMPGMGNHFTALAVKRLGDLEKVSVRCGGLPQNPKPPLDYMLVFSVAGLTNEYFGHADVLRDGKLATVPTFTELEPIDWPGMGRLEAFITSGGLSTTPWTFAGKIKSLDYKTIRYPGHYEKFKVLLDLGLLSEQAVRVGANDVVPRQLLHVLLERVLAQPGDKDLVLLSMHAVATNGAKLEMHVEDRLDEATGFTAMERSTAYSAAACAHLIAAGKVPHGPQPLELAVDPELYLQALQARGISVRVHQTAAK